MNYRLEYIDKDLSNKRIYKTDLIKKQSIEDYLKKGGQVTICTLKTRKGK